MKKHLFYASLFVAALSSCSKDDDRVSKPSASVNNDLETIQLSVANSESFNVETRGSGMVGGLTEATNVWNGQDLYILMTKEGTVEAVEPDYDLKTGEGDAEVDVTPETILNNVKVAAPTDVTSGAITGTENTPGHHYYYPISGEFDFYGYHVDDAAGDTPTPTESENDLTLNVEIDGSQDLMVAKADFTADYKYNTELEGKNYSAYAARRGVQPMLNFQHLLSQLQFQVVNKGTENLSVESIGINSAYKATMTVAGTNYGKIVWEEKAEDDETLLYVQEPGDDGEYTELESKELPVKTAEGLETTVKIGNILLPAGTEEAAIFVYEGEIVLKQTCKATVEGEEGLEDKDVTAYSTIPFRITMPESASARNFAAGYAYTVKFSVYGLSKIGVTANLTQWSNGGSFDLTPEDQVATQEEAIFTASTIQKAWVVKDQASYANVPEDYRNDLGEWGTNGLDESLPWLLVAFTPNADETITFTVQKGEGETRTYTWSKSATSSFFTINNAELNEGFEGEEVWEMTPGSIWTITVNGETVTLTI